MKRRISFATESGRALYLSSLAWFVGVPRPATPPATRTKPAPARKRARR